MSERFYDEYQVDIQVSEPQKRMGWQIQWREAKKGYPRELCEHLDSLGAGH